MNLREASQSSTVGTTPSTISQPQLSSTLHFSLGVDAFAGMLASIYNEDVTGETLYGDTEVIAMV